jgi:hypothetical protein
MSDAAMPAADRPGWSTAFQEVGIERERIGAPLFGQDVYQLLELAKSTSPFCQRLDVAN